MLVAQLLVAAKILAGPGAGDSIDVPAKVVRAAPGVLAPSRVEAGSVFELSLTFPRNFGPEGNVFHVELSAEITSPRGVRETVHGFDQSGVYAIDFRAVDVHGASSRVRRVIVRVLDAGE